MCLAIPGKIVSLRNNQALVNFNGIKKEVNCKLVEVKTGDYVIVHAGFAIQKLDQKEALEAIKLFKNIKSIRK